MKNKKNGFTLVELLAVIVILAIILVIAVPKIMTVIEDAKKATLESSAKMVASEAEKRKVQNQVLGKDENITCENVTNINDIDYKNCYIEFLNNTAYVTIIGSNKFENMYVCKGTKNDSRVVDRCPNERVSVTIDPAGGSVKDLSGIYKEGDIIELENPEKEHATFINWNVVKGNSTLSDNKLIVGSEDTIVWADYEEWGELTIDLDGGSVSNNQNGKYQSGTMIELETPTKENYKFIEWEKIEGNGIVSGTMFTMGSLDTKIKAKWELNAFKLNVNLGGGNSAQEFKTEYEIGSKITLETPTKEGYTFDSWSVSGTGASINDNVLTMGIEETTITANWYKFPVLDTNYPANATIVKYNSVTSKIKISEDGYPAEYTYQWYKNGSAISGATSASYTFTPTTVGTITLYCKVTNSAGTITSRTATINVQEAYIYNAGTINTAFTGGLSVVGQQAESDIWAEAPTVSIGSNSIYLYKGGSGDGDYNRSGVYYTNNLIDLTNFNTISVVVTGHGGDTYWSDVDLIVTQSKTGIVSPAAKKSIESVGTHTLSVSSLNGKYYIGIMLKGKGACSVTFTQWKIS